MEEDEWEYGINWDNNQPIYVDPEQDEGEIKKLAYRLELPLRRRKVGPWEVVSNGTTHVVPGETP